MAQTIRKFSIDPGSDADLQKPSRILSKREADTEFQYRPHIADTDIDCGRRFLRTPLPRLLHQARKRKKRKSISCITMRKKLFFFFFAMRKPLGCAEFTGKVPQELPRESCDVGPRCEKSTCFFSRSSDAKCLRCGLCDASAPRCQIASDAGRAMRVAKTTCIAEKGVVYKFPRSVVYRLHPQGVCKPRSFN